MADHNHDNNEKECSDTTCPLSHKSLIPPMSHKEKDNEDKGDIKVRGQQGMEVYFSDKPTRTRIIFNLFNKDKSMKEIAANIETDYDTIKKTISRSSSGLLALGFIELSKTEGKTKIFKVTKRGKLLIETTWQTHLDLNKPPAIDVTEELEKETKQRIDLYLDNNICKLQIAQIKTSSNSTFSLDYFDMMKTDPKLAEKLDSEFSKTLKMFYDKIRDICDITEDFTPSVVVINLPQSFQIPLHKIRSINNLEKLCCIRGDVVQRTATEIITFQSTYECPSCGNIIKVLQLEPKLKEPNKCGCGRKGKFRHLEDEDVDRHAIKLTFREPPGEHDHGNPQVIYCVGYDEITQQENILNPGMRIHLNGVIKSERIMSDKVGTAKLRRKEFIFEINNVILSPDDLQVEVSQEEREKFEEYAKKYDMLNECVDAFYTIKGNLNIKYTLLLQLMGGVREVLSNNKVERGTIHILIVGDAGTGKSDLVYILDKITPKIRKTTGTGASGVGLTASVKKDEFLGDWVVNDGAVVSANGGLLVVDEADKMSKQIIEKLHEPMEQGTNTINKANINTQLPARTAILFLANPKDGRFSNFDNPITEFPKNMTHTFLSRMDLMFSLIDIPKEGLDTQIAQKIYKRRKEKYPCKFSLSEIRKYISYAQSKKPVLPDYLADIMSDWFATARQVKKEGEEVRVLSFLSKRQIESIRRLVQARAKWRLADEASIEDWEFVQKLMVDSFSSLSKDKDTLERFLLGSSFTGKRVKELIIGIMEKEPGKLYELEELKQQVMKIQKTSEGSYDEAIQLLKNTKEIFEAKSGKVKLL